MNKAVIVSNGLHGPWNMGEVVLARNFSEVLLKIYSDVHVLSTVDSKRGDAQEFRFPEFKVEFFDSKKGLSVALVNHLRCHCSVDVHFINASLASFLSILPVARRVFLYQFAYNVLNVPSTITRSLTALPLTYLSNLRIITTSFSSYEKLSKLFRRHYYYEPAPMHQEKFRNGLKQTDDSYALKILYLGHGSYLRFPYDKTLGALTRLHAEGHRIKLKVYVSKLGYADYVNYVAGFSRYIEKCKAGDFVELSLENLSETQKLEAISDCDVVLCPAVIGAAIDPPLVILEAMALGKCVIASSIQSIPHILGNDRGIVINPKHLEEELYTELKKIAQEPNIVKEYAYHSKQWVLSEHNIQTVCDRMKNVIGYNCEY